MTDGSGVQKQAAAGKTTGSMSGRKPTVWAKHTRGGLFLRLQLSRAKSEQSRTAACGRMQGEDFIGRKPATEKERSGIEVQHGERENYKIRAKQNGRMRAGCRARIL